jgi:hypothetical protein
MGERNGKVGSTRSAGHWIDTQEVLRFLEKLKIPLQKHDIVELTGGKRPLEAA